MISSEDDVMKKVIAIFSERKSLFNFGSCCERKTFMEKTPPTRLGMLYPLKTDNPQLGPGSYYPDYDSFYYNLDTQPCSPYGWSFGARMAPQIETIKDNGVPVPTHYQKGLTKPRAVKQNIYPFNRKCLQRFPGDLKGNDTPGVGTYDWFKEHKPLAWQRDTNLKPVNLPQIAFKSTVPANTNKLPTSYEERKYQRCLRFFENYF